MAPDDFLVGISGDVEDADGRPLFDLALLDEAAVSWERFLHVGTGLDGRTLGIIGFAPHAVGLTDELFRSSGRSVSRAALAVRDGRMPEFAINPEASPALARPGG